MGRRGKEGGGGGGGGGRRGRGGEEGGGGGEGRGSLNDFKFGTLANCSFFEWRRGKYDVKRGNSAFLNYIYIEVVYL